MADIPAPGPASVPSGLTLLLGGARSGKSTFAVTIGRRFGGAVTMVATATAFDDDMALRIRRHRAERPAWATIEEPIALTRALHDADPAHLVIVDCLTLWVSNMMLMGTDEPGILALAAEAASVAAGRRAPTVVISNEVGFGVHPPTELGRGYQDALGRVNQAWASVADRALLLVAGRALVLGDAWDTLWSR